LICVTAELYSFLGLRFSLLAQAPTFRTGTTLVEFTVVALDAKGKPVTDLTKADLQLTDRGQPREIAFLRFDGDGSPGETRAPLSPLSPGFVSNRPEYLPEPQKNVTAIVMDFVNTAPHDQNRARTQLLRYLKTLPAISTVGLFRFTDAQRVTMLAPFTNRVELLREQIDLMESALRRELTTPGILGRPIVGGDCTFSGGQTPIPGANAAGGGSGRGSGTMAEGRATFDESQARTLSAVNQAMRSARLDSTLANLEALGNHLAAIPGRKNVVWISSGMPIQLTGDSRINYEPPIRVVAQRLANQGIVIYPVDAKGNCRQLERSTSEGRYGIDDATQHVFSSLNVLADLTGGRVTKYEDDLSKGIMAAASDLRGTYTMGFYASDEPNDRWHSLQVATSRRGVTLRHRQGYLSVARPQPQSLTPEAWSQVAQAPLGSSAIRLNGRPTLGPQQVTLLLQIAAGDLYFQSRGGNIVADLEIGVVEKNPARTTSMRQQPLEVILNDPSKDQRLALITSATTWPLDAATTSVRVIVRDRLTGKHGTLEIPLSQP
jgi:VWFA-related protein